MSRYVIDTCLGGSESSNPTFNLQTFKPSKRPILQPFRVFVYVR